jgi:signal transduction histidine kinase/CheY-like chemotaxis protein
MIKALFRRVRICTYFKAALRSRTTALYCMLVATLAGIAWLSGGLDARMQRADNDTLRNSKRLHAGVADLNRIAGEMKAREERLDSQAGELEKALEGIVELSREIQNTSANRNSSLSAWQLTNAVHRMAFLNLALGAPVTSAGEAAKRSYLSALAVYRQKASPRERALADELDRQVVTLRDTMMEAAGQRTSAALHRSELLGSIGTLAASDDTIGDPLTNGGSRTLRWITVLAFLGAGSVGLIVAAQRSTIFKKIEQFAKAARAAANGRIERCMPGTTGGPLEELNAAFNQMLDVHAKALEEARLSQEKFDLRVRARTAELWKANKTLQEESLKRQQAEKEFQQAQKMDALGKFAGSIAHDFNNLLTVIINGVECARQKLGGNGAVAAILKTVGNAAERGAGLTRPLLAFSRNQVHETEPLCLNEAAEETIQLAGRLIGVNIEVRVELDPHLRLIEANSNQIQQVLMNLAINARDAMDGKGVLTISTANATIDRERVAELGLRDEVDWVALSVSDSGCGMDELTRQRIFEPFFTTKAEGRGTGLGLSTVFGIVRQCGGYVDVQSAPGEGSTFRVLFPATHKTKTVMTHEPELRPVESTDAGKCTLLLVDDEDEIRELAAMMLESSGYRVISAATAADAIVLAEQYAEELSLVITDVTMPGMNGVELAEVLVRRLAKVKILFVSGHSEETVYAESIKDAEIYFLQKPYRSEDLHAKVAEAIRGACVYSACGEPDESAAA